MRVEIDGTTYCGPAVDLSGAPVDGETVAAAVREGAARTARDQEVSVACLQPAPVHERVGHVRPGMSVRVRTALAAAARSRGLTAPPDERLCTIRERLAAVDPPDDPDMAGARRRAAGTAADVERLREQVATLRGRLTAAREAGRDADDVEADLHAAVRGLSEAETERAAAREAVEAARREARTVRDCRERRRRLEDERANLARAARADLVDALRGEFAAALAAVPGRGDGTSASGGRTAQLTDRETADPFDADPVPAALAVCRVADLHAPVVLDCDRFPDAASAARWLDAPVARV